MVKQVAYQFLSPSKNDSGNRLFRLQALSLPPPLPSCLPFLRLQDSMLKSRYTCNRKCEPVVSFLHPPLPHYESIKTRTWPLLLLFVLGLFVFCIIECSLVICYRRETLVNHNWTMSSLAMLIRR